MDCKKHHMFKYNI